MERDEFTTNIGRKITAGLGAFIVLILALSWIIQGNEFFLYKVFAPKQEQARRETFEQSKAYNDGMVQELQAMQFEYAKADQAHKDALGSVILHKVANYDLEKLPPDLKQFVQTLKRERTMPQNSR